MNIESEQFKIRQAVQKLHRRYRKNPWIFMTEADIQCSLYATLIHSHLSKPKRAIVRDRYGEKLKNKVNISTIPVHAELSYTERRKTKFVDLCLIDPSEFIFLIRKTKTIAEKKRFPITNWHWDTQRTIGIEIKINYGVSKDSLDPQANRNWQIFKERLVVDLKKLKIYKRGWLILVDHQSTFSNKKEWRKFAIDIIRRSNPKKSKKLINAYYLSPSTGTAWSYKAPGSSF